MMALADAFAVCGTAMALCAGALSLQRFGRHKNFVQSPWLKGLLLALFVGLLVPISASSIPLAAFFRGFVGDLSISLLALSFWSLCHRLLGVLPISKRELTALMAVVAVAALLLYPTALGWGDWDAYRLGWGSWLFLLALLLLCGGSAWIGLRVLPALVALALLAWSIGLMASGNLWDYLLDPWLSAFALGYVINKVFIKYWQIVRRRFS